MDLDEPQRIPADFAGKLSGESLDHLSVHELDARIALLEAEIARTAAHRDRAQSHRAAAEALFGRPAAPPEGPR